LRVLYINKRMTPGMIAIKIGCSRRTIARRLKEFNIQTIKRFEATRNELIGLYVNRRLSCREVAERLGCGSWTINRRLKKYGIPVRKPTGQPGRFEIPKEFLRDQSKSVYKGKFEVPKCVLKDLYIDRKMTMEQIAARFGCSATPICRGLKEHGITIQPSWKRRWLQLPEDEIVDLYVNRKMTVAGISEKFGCSRGTVEKRLIKHNILRRNTVGKNNGNYKGVTKEMKRLNVMMSSGIRNSIKRGKGKRRVKWLSLIPYTHKDLIRHLKKTIPPGYSWRDDFINRKNILQIDHIIPISAFNFSEPEHGDFQKCWALNNLRLLPRIENARKNARLDKPFQPSLLM